MFSKRVTNMSPSATSMLIGKIKEKRAAGEDIIAFSAGEPDFQTPQPVVDACIEAIKNGKTKYEGVAGIMPLRKAVCDKLRRDNGLEYKPEQICIATGAKQALFNTIMALADEGDEVIIPFPCWVSYVEMVKLAGAEPVLVETNPDFSLNIEKIRRAVTTKTKLIIINTPNNPTGAVYSAESLKALAEIAISNDFFIISDEVYEKLVYGKSRHVSIASVLPEAYGRTIIINGMSKAFSMTGWRIGYAAGPEKIISAVTGLQSHQTSNSTSFVQYAAIAALTDCDEAVESMRKAFGERRDYMCERINSLPGVSCAQPEGAFYVMPDMSSYIGKKKDTWVIGSTSDLCNYLLEEAGVAVVPGEAFYMPHTIRIAYSTSMEKIAEGMDRMEAALAALK